MKAKKLLAVVLAAVLIASVFSVAVFAAEAGITTPPKKTEYIVGECFDPTSMKINNGTRNISYSSGTKKNFSFIPSPETPLTATDTAVKVYYQDAYIGDVAITVISSVSIFKNPDVTEYLPGENFNPDGLSVKAGSKTISYSSTTKKDFTFTPSLTTALTKANAAVKVYYMGLYAGEVAISFPSDFSIVENPNNTVYVAGDKLVLTGLKIGIGTREVAYSSEKANFSSEPAANSVLAPDAELVKIYYKGTYISDVAISVYSISQEPANKSYNPGEYFNPAGLKIKCGSSEIPYVEGNTDFSFNPSLSTPLTISNKSVAVTYKGKAIGNITIGVNGVITQPSKTTYTVGEKVDGTGLTIAYNGSTISYPDAGFSFVPSESTVLKLTDTTVSIYYNGDYMGKYNITVEGLMNGPAAEFATEGKSLDPKGLATKFDGAVVNYEDDPAGFTFSPSIEAPVVLKKDASGNILPVKYTVYYKGYEVGSFEIAVNHDFGGFVQLESGKEHAKICKQCGELTELEACAGSVHNFKPNDDAGLFKLQTETGTCDKCNGTVTRNIEGSNKFDNIFDFIHEDAMAATELTILEYFKLILVSLIQMIIPV